MIFRLFSLLLFGAILVGCETEYVPKPKAYHKIVFPERGYQNYATDCPFTFEYPTYAKIAQTDDGVPCWFNVAFEQLNGNIYFSYKPITKQAPFAVLLEDMHKMTFKHTKKATFIDEVAYNNGKGVKGIIYDVGGDAASALQFYLTDENKHFVRGALYFNSTPNADSMQPVVDFVREDMMHLLESFEWQ